MIFSLNSGISTPSENLYVRAVNGYFDFYIYKYAIGFFIIIFFILSIFVWDYLDKAIQPAIEISNQTSSMPRMEKMQ